VGVS
jgi:hypothetical protein